ncbi:NUDIX domain-containing protein [candidate division KSB1 bacterium]|nr:NUDIX domain-containing protein [candidate division KSB1 bacterium]
MKSKIWQKLIEIISRLKLEKKRPRTSAKAIIIENGKLFVLKKKAANDIYYVLPGGGQRHGENLIETLKRECLEETGAEVEVGDLVCLREYIGAHHEFSDVHSHLHQNDLMFSCKILNDYTTVEPTEEDEGQIGMEWLPLESLEQYNLYPKILRSYLKIYNPGEGKTYLGDIN